MLRKVQDQNIYYSCNSQSLFSLRGQGVSRAIPSATFLASSLSCELQRKIASYNSAIRLPTGVSRKLPSSDFLRFFKLRFFCHLRWPSEDDHCPAVRGHWFSVSGCHHIGVNLLCIQEVSLRKGFQAHKPCNRKRSSREGGTPSYTLYRYVPPDRVGFLRCSVLK